MLIVMSIDASIDVENIVHDWSFGKQVAGNKSNVTINNNPPMIILSSLLPTCKVLVSNYSSSNLNYFPR